MPLTPNRSENPWSVEERWVVSNMLAVTTGQISNPVAMLVLVVTNDGLLHTVRSLSVRWLLWSDGRHATFKRTPVKTFQCHRYRFSNGNSGR